MQFQEIHFYHPRPGELETFYTELLGKEAVTFDTTRLFLQIGDTALSFWTSETPSVYHYAINCAYDAIHRIPDFLGAFAEILKGPAGEDIIEFPNWKARSVYFKDPAGNIVELIGRQRLDIENRGETRPAMTCVSEVGLATNDLPHIRRKIASQIPLEEFWVSGDNFVAFGDDEGLLITVDTSSKTWYPTAEQARVYGWTTRVLANNTSYQLRYDGRELYVRRAG